MNNLVQFKNGENINLLWEVLLDELKLNTSNPNVCLNL